MLLGPVIGLAVFAIPLAIVGLFDSADVFGSIVLGLSMFLIAVFYAYLLSFLPAFFAGLIFQLYYFIAVPKFHGAGGVRILIGSICGFFSQAVFLLILLPISGGELRQIADGTMLLIPAAIAGAVCGWSSRGLSTSA